MPDSTTPVAADTVVTLRFRVDDAKGNPLQTKAEEVAYLHGGYDNLLPKVEAALQGQAAGFATTVTLSPQEGFGERDEALVRTVARTELPVGTKVGGQVQGVGADGVTPQLFRVTKFKGDQAQLDGNHPFAGLTVRFVVRVLGVRPATLDEVRHRHVHGEGGHHH